MTVDGQKAEQMPELGSQPRASDDADLQALSRRAQAFALGRLLIRDVADPLEALTAETIRIAFTSDRAGVTMSTAVYPPATIVDEGPGRNPTGVAIAWSTVEEMVIETWSELAGYQHLTGSLIDIWFTVPGDYGEFQIFVRVPIDAQNNRWKYIDACRSAIEDASRPN